MLFLTIPAHSLAPETQQSTDEAEANQSIKRFKNDITRHRIARGLDVPFETEVLRCAGR